MFSALAVAATDSPVTNHDLNANVNSIQLISLVVGVVLPLIVALVTQRTTNKNVKALLLLALSGVSGFLTEYLNSSNFVWQQALVTTGATFLVGVGMHFGVWKDSPIQQKAQDTLTGH